MVPLSHVSGFATCVIGGTLYSATENCEKTFKGSTQAGVVAHTFKLSPWEAEAVDLCEFEAGRAYTVSSRTPRASL